MTDIEQKALALLNEASKAKGHKVFDQKEAMRIYDITFPAIVAAIEAHEATKQELSDFRQEVSDAVETYFGGLDLNTSLHRFIIPAPKPDPLVEVMEKLGWYNAPTDAENLRAALDDLGFEIREKNDD